MKKILTNRELEVLALAAEGLSNPKIAKELTISIHTVKAHICSIIEKLEANGRVQAAVRAAKMNLI
ncbi:MAG: LuxR C-terminal-related transcriptional regulator [Candidatus Gastranaerophilales bacterium]|nr:LuxR C-terminal-related transcriptional regulator [Candidatus Gastranaerophilales bacterium]